MMYWFRKQGAFWRDYIDVHPFRMLGLIAFVLIGGVILGDVTGTALRPLVNPPPAAAPSPPVFTQSPSVKPKRRPVRTHSEAPQPTYRPEPRPTVPRPTRTSHSPSPTPKPTKVSPTPKPPKSPPDPCDRLVPPPTCQPDPGE